MNASEFGCGAAHQLAITAAKAGWELEDFSILTKSEKKCREVLQFLRGEAELVIKEVVINCDVQPQIPDWADKDKPIIKHVGCGIIDPSKLTTVSVFKDGEDVLEGEEFITRAQKLKSMNACAFDFYSQPENWKYLPKDVDVIVFAQTEFRRADGGRCVRYLYRDGSSWNRHYGWFDRRFGRFCAVAVLAS